MSKVLQMIDFDHLYDYNQFCFIHDKLDEAGELEELLYWSLDDKEKSYIEHNGQEGEKDE